MDLPAWAPGNVLRPGRYRSILIGQGLLQLPPGADAELGEYLAQVPFDGPGTDEELSADLLVRQAVPSEPRDERFLLGELIGGIDGALAYGRAGGQQFAASSLGETPHSHGGEHLIGEGQLTAGQSPYSR